MVLAGGGELPPGVIKAFVRLAGGTSARIAVVVTRAEDADARWKDQKVAAVDVVKLTSERNLQAEEALAPMLDATGIWLASGLDKLDGNKVLQKLLQGVVARGGVAGGNGSGAIALAHFSSGRKSAGFEVLPRSVLVTNYDHKKNEADLVAALKENPGCVGWGIPPRAALVVHRGRRVCAVGEGTVTARVLGGNGWDERAEHLECADYNQRWDELPNDLDFLAWTRSAQLRTQPVFPPKIAPVPELKKGTLVINGGRKVTDEAFERFIKAAGGKSATFVCIPSGNDQDEDDLESYSAKNLRERGCDKVSVLHTHDRNKANDTEFTARLEEATGVWMDGGRTYRLMDSIQHNRVHELIRGVLARGGAVGGSSAGAQAVGDFLMRGNPATNETLWWDGYQTGLGLICGVIIDAHFRQRERQNTFPEVMKTFPQMLGIGLDENATLVITGSTAEVVGENNVTFYDYSGDKKTDVMLSAGEKYDLKARAKVE